MGKTFPKIELQKLEKFVNLNFAIDRRKHEFGHLGGPWEFNLRDLTRFLELITHQNLPEFQAFYLIYVSRMRTQADRNILISIFNEILVQSDGVNADQSHEDPFSGMFEVETDKIKFENFSIGRKYEKRNACSLNDPILDTQFTKIIEKILLGVKNGWMVQESFQIELEYNIPNRTKMTYLAPSFY